MSEEIRVPVNRPSLHPAAPTSVLVEGADEDEFSGLTSEPKIDFDDLSC